MIIDKLNNFQVNIRLECIFVGIKKNREILLFTDYFSYHHFYLEPRLKELGMYELFKTTLPYNLTFNNREEYEKILPTNIMARLILNFAYDFKEQIPCKKILLHNKEKIYQSQKSLVN